MTVVREPEVNAETPNQTARARRVKGETETPEFIAFLRRIIRRAGQRVGDADEIELALLIAVEQEVKAAISNAVEGQRSRGVSWAGIALATGKSRESAWKRWGRKRGEERP